MWRVWPGTGVAEVYVTRVCCNPLERAPARNLYAYECVREVERLAAAYEFGIARNHPFVDGNKRTAFLAIGLFLLKNGYVLDAQDAEATQAMFALAAGDLTEAELVEWIRRHSSAKSK
jgi:death on curing protein